MKLEKITVDKEGNFFIKDDKISFYNLIPLGKPITFPLHNFEDLDKIIENWTKENLAVIPKFANSYIISEFNGSTQHLRKDVPGFYSVYAVQFYDLLTEMD